MSFDYAALKTKVSSIVDNFDQGDIYYRPQGTDAGEPWDPQPAEGVPVKIDAVAFGVSAQYVDETVLASDIEVTASVWDATPELSGEILINNVPHQIIRITRIPSAGTVVAWQIIVRK